MNWQIMGFVGQILSGLALSIGSATAIFVFIKIQKKQVEDAMSASFREIYRQFWYDIDCTEVRKWILNEEIYRNEIKAVLAARNAKNKFEWSMARADHEKLEQLDRFCSFMMRALSFPRHRMSLHDQAIWEGFLDPIFWMDRISRREEMYIYILTHWQKLNPKQLDILSRQSP